METSSSGSQSASRTYYAYGSTRSSSGTLQTDRTFTGQKQDGTGLHYYNARYYDSTLGTFLSPDTLVPDAGRVVDYNRFLYVRANPLRFSDPTGDLSEDEIRNYYGYEGDDRDALRQSMLDDGWNENLANWLLNPDTHFGDVFTYFDRAGQRVGEAMLALFETGERQFRGGFYGLTGRGAGVEVGRQEVHSFNDDTPLSITLKEKYAGGYTDLPKRTGSDYRNYYDPATYRNYGTGSWAGAGASGVGTAYTVKTCSTPWSCAVGVILSALALVLAPPRSTNYPIILQPDTGGIGNPPSIPSLKPPQGAYQH